MAKKKTLATFFAGLAVALMLAFTTTAYAAEPPESTDLYIHKHMVTNIVTGSGNPGTGEEDATVTAQPLNGIKFNIYEVAGTPEAGKVYRIDGTTLKVYDVDGSTLLGDYNLSLVDTVTTGDEGQGTALKTELPEGVYLVEEDLATSSPKDSTGKAVKVSSAAKPFIVSLPMTNAAGNDYLHQVHVYPKNEALVVEKEVGITNGDAVVVGSVVPYTITSTIPDGIKESKGYAVTDQLNDALDLTIPTGGSAYDAVTVTAVAGDLVLDAETDYEVTYEDRLLTVSLTETGRAKLAGYTSVKVAFSATVNDAILSAPGQTVGNEATLQFTNKDNTTFEANTGDEGPKIHTAGILVTKLDQAGKDLNGATFKIATSEQNAKNGYFLRLDPETKILYDYGTDGWGTLENNDYTILPKNKAEFVGLQDRAGGELQSYWVVETVAPTGYNLAANPFQVTFTGNEEGYVAKLEVVNNKGFTLPETGGMGTVLFVVGGIVLLGVAAIIVIAPWKKRKKNNETEK